MVEIDGDEIDGDEIALTPEGRIMPLPGAIEALSRLKDSRVFVISNQAAVAVGSLPAMQAYDYIRQINELCGGAVTDFRFAMHPANADHPWAPNRCREWSRTWRWSTAWTFCVAL